MFALGGGELRLRLLGCADGPASFNAEATGRGLRVVSCDPLYRYGANAIRARIAAIFDEMVAQTRQNESEFVWSEAIPSVGALARMRAAAMDRFLDDYDAGRRLGSVHRRRAAGAPVRRRCVRPRGLLALSVSLHEAADRRLPCRRGARAVACRGRRANFSA